MELTMNAALGDIQKSGIRVFTQMAKQEPGCLFLTLGEPDLDTPLSVDAAAPDGSLIQFINGEDRYADLRMIDPAEAAILQPDLQKRTARIYSIIKAQSTGNLF